MGVVHINNRSVHITPSRRQSSATLSRSWAANRGSRCPGASACCGASRSYCAAADLGPSELPAFPPDTNSFHRHGDEQYGAHRSGAAEQFPVAAEAASQLAQAPCSNESAPCSRSWAGGWTT